MTHPGGLWLCMDSVSCVGGDPLRHQAEHRVDNLVQVPGVSLCPVPQQAQNGLAVVAQNQSGLKAGTVLVEVLLIAHLLKQALEVLVQCGERAYIIGAVVKGDSGVELI